MTSRAPETPKITTRSLAPDDWPVVERLFGANGACGGCWCMSWRVPRRDKLWDNAEGARNKAAFRRLVKASDVHAVRSAGARSGRTTPSRGCGV